VTFDQGSRGASTRPAGSGGGAGGRGARALNSGIPQPAKMSARLMSPSTRLGIEPPVRPARRLTNRASAAGT
jgi:hypothetical protein